MPRWTRWIVGTLMLVALAALPPGCANDRTRINEHQQALDAERD